MLENQAAPAETTPEPDVSFLAADMQAPVTPHAEQPLHKLDLNESKAPTNKKPSFLRKHRGLFVIILVVLLLIGGTVAGLGYYTFKTAMEMKSQAEEAKLTIQQAYIAFKTQNLPQTNELLKKVGEQEQQLRATYTKLAFYKFIPIAGAYYGDGEHAFNAAEAGLRAGKKSLDAITPYADVLGFTGQGTFAGGTAEDRLKVVLDTVDKISPVLDDITTDLKTMDSELQAINPNRYPTKIKDQEVRSQIVKVQQLGNGAVTALTEFRPAIEQLPTIAGSKGRKKYLVLFQNDNELRPTGGFLTAYATIFVENGKVSPEKSDDIYELDKKFHKNLPIPPALGRYLTTEKKWNLRDMNISPDFKESMDQFLANYKQVPGEPTDIDGVITVDTKFLTALIKVLGPIEVPGYGTFTAENDPSCDCPQVVHALSEIITRPTPYIKVDRKGILGPMMRTILTKAYSAPKQQWPDMFQLGFDKIASRDIQMYFMDAKAQQAAETINAAGRMKPSENNDFLAIVDANLGGAKSNLYIDYDVLQTVSAPENGVITKTVEITYKNNHKADNCNLEAGLLCLNSTLRDWSRLYLPKGSKLVEANGYVDAAKEYDEGEFHVVDGFFKLEPLSQAKLKITYTVPYQDTTTYRAQLWKQGGISPVKEVMDVNGSQEEILLNKDILYEAKF